MVEINMLQQALRQGEKKIAELEKKDQEQEEKFTKLWEVVLDTRCRTLNVGRPCSCSFRKY
jgi:hypothetical protein